MTEQELQDLQKMVEIAVSALEDVKAKDIAVLETQDKTSLFARMIIASGDSSSNLYSLGDKHYRIESQLNKLIFLLRHFPLTRYASSPMSNLREYLHREFYHF